MPRIAVDPQPIVQTPAGHKYDLRSSPFTFSCNPSNDLINEIAASGISRSDMTRYHLDQLFNCRNSHKCRSDQLLVGLHSGCHLEHQAHSWLASNLAFKSRTGIEPTISAFFACPVTGLPTRQPNDLSVCALPGVSGLSVRGVVYGPSARSLKGAQRLELCGFLRLPDGFPARAANPARCRSRAGPAKE